jgi:replicative DNA helicase
MCHPNGMPQPFSATTNEDERRISRRKGRQYEYGTARFGIPELDVLTGGIEDFGYICAMALTGVGKTGLAIQCAISTAWAIKDEITGAAMLEREATDRGEKAAMQDASKLVSEAQKKLVVYFALEEGRWQLRLRMAGFCGRFDTYDCRTAEAWSKVLRDDPSLETTYQTAMTTVSKLPILITDEPQTVSSIEAHCKRIAKDSKPVLIIVDYMQQVGKDIAGTYSEEQQYRIMANTFRRLSDKLECPILGLSQVTEQGTGKARVMSAAGATAMEKSGDMNLVIERKKNDDTDEPEPFVTIRCRKAKGAPYFKPFKCYEDPKSRRWSAVRDQPDDPQPDSKKPRDRKDN